MNGHYESQTANMQSSSVIDVNGDGRSDLIMKVTESDAACYDGSRIVPLIRSKWECERDIGGVWVEATNTYHKLFIASGTSSSPSLTFIQSLGLGIDTLRVADINGDGLSDLL